MENLDLVTIFWLVTMGMVVGGVIKVALGNRGMGLVANVAGGIFGTVTVGVIGIMLQIPGSMLFGLLGSLAILFIANVFNQQPEESH
jgi:hypothetical protein